MQYRRIDYAMEREEWKMRGVTVKPAPRVDSLPTAPLPNPQWKYSVCDCLLLCLTPQTLKRYPDAHIYDGAAVVVAGLLQGVVDTDGQAHHLGGGVYRIFFEDGADAVVQEYELRRVLEDRPRMN